MDINRKKKYNKQKYQKILRSYVNYLKNSNVVFLPSYELIKQFLRKYLLAGGFFHSWIIIAKAFKFLTVQYLTKKINIGNMHYISFKVMMALP